MTLSTYRQAHSIAIKYRGIMIPFENSYPLFVKKKIGTNADVMNWNLILVILTKVQRYNVHVPISSSM